MFQFRSSSLDCCPSSNFPFLWGGRGALSSTSQMKSIHEDRWNLIVGFRLPFRRRLPRVLCLVCCGLSTSTLPFAWLLHFGVCSCFLLHCFSAALSVCRINSAEGFETLQMKAFRECGMSRASDTVRARGNDRKNDMISSAFDLRRLRSGDMGSRRLHVCWHVALLDTAHVGKFDLCVTLLHVLLPIEDHWTSGFSLHSETALGSSRQSRQT